MRPAPDFTRILDEKLGASVFPGPSTERRAGQPAWDPGPRPVFLFGDSLNGFSAGPGWPASASGAPSRTPVYGAGLGAQSRRADGRQVPLAAPSGSATAAAGRDDRPGRLLSSAQREALDVLRTLGAGWLSDRFTDAEIKSAFRQLARRFHPDRHPCSSETERQRLARAFAAACDSYRTLTAAVH